MIWLPEWTKTQHTTDSVHVAVYMHLVFYRLDRRRRQRLVII